MPLGDVSYVNASLDGVIASWPTGTYQLYSADPQLADALSDVRLDLAAAGLSAPAFDPADWDAAADGSVQPTTHVSFGTSTGPLSDPGTYWGVEDGSGLLVFSDDLDDADVIVIDEAGTDATFYPYITFGAGA